MSLIFQILIVKVEHFNLRFAEDKGLIYSGHLNCHKQRGGEEGEIEMTQSTLRGRKWTPCVENKYKCTNTHKHKYANNSNTLELSQTIETKQSTFFSLTQFVLFDFDFLIFRTDCHLAENISKQKQSTTF